MAESGSKVLNRIRICSTDFKRILCGSEPAAVLQEQPGQPRGGAVQAPALSEEPDTTPLHSSAPGTALQYLRQSGVGSRSFFAGLPKLSIFYCSGSGQIPAPAPTSKYVYLKETSVNCYWYFF